MERTYSRHRCDKSHKSYRTAAKCIWPWKGHSFWGDGPYIIREKLWGPCGLEWHCEMYATEAEANARWEFETDVHEGGHKCCGSCTRTLERYYLEPTVLEPGNKVDWV
jgi:hypothetical protein